MEFHRSESFQFGNSFPATKSTVRDLEHSSNTTKEMGTKVVHESSEGRLVYVGDQNPLTTSR